MLAWQALYVCCKIGNDKLEQGNWILEILIALASLGNVMVINPTTYFVQIGSKSPNVYITYSRNVGYEKVIWYYCGTQ